VIFLSSRKNGLKKRFLIAARKKIGPGITNAPIWAIQKKGERIWNKTLNRHWRRTHFGKLFRKLKA
jgi:ribosomal protein L39E